MLTGYEPKSKEAQMLNESLEAAQKAEKIWLEAMQDARRAGQKTPANSVTGGEIKKSFSLKEDVEETKDLIAVHNITEDKLNKQLKLEGFPMISIAVTKTDIGHSNFGDITVVFKKDTIDPANKKPQRVVGYDEVAYWILPDNTSEETRKRIEKASETAPILEYKKGDENQRKNIINSLNDVKFSLKEDKKITEFADEIEDIINKKGTIPNWKKIDVGTVTDSEASAIKSVIGIDTKGWKNKCSADDMAHLIERHGKNGEADKTMKNNSDIGKTNEIGRASCRERV